LTFLVDTVDFLSGRFINGDIANPNLTVSNAEAGDAGNYVCQLCYASNFSQCTNSPTIQLIVTGTGKILLFCLVIELIKRIKDVKHTKQGGFQ
jgi:hypothetical protein